MRMRFGTSPAFWQAHNTQQNRMIAACTGIKTLGQSAPTVPSSAPKLDMTSVLLVVAVSPAELRAGA
jgi:hypothetical protein